MTPDLQDDLQIRRLVERWAGWRAGALNMHRRRRLAIDASRATPARAAGTKTE